MLLIVWYSWRLVKENVMLEFLWKAFNVSYMEYLQRDVNFEAARGWQKESIPRLRHCDAVEGYIGL